MLTRILRVTGVEAFKLVRRPATYVLAALLLAVVAGQALVTAGDVRSQHDRTRELNAWLVFADAGGTGLFVASLLLVLHASVACSGEVGLGTLKALLVRPVTRAELMLGKVLALLLAAAGLGAGVLGTAAVCGAALSDYGGVRTVTHSERTIGLMAAPPADPAAPRDGKGRLGFAGEWDAGAGALRITEVAADGLAAQRGLQAGDIVTHQGGEDGRQSPLASLDDWRARLGRLQEGDVVTLTVDHPIETVNRDFTREYLLRQTGLALAMIPLPLAAAACFGLLWSTWVESVGFALGGALLSYFLLRFVLAQLIVVVVRLTAGPSVFVQDVERFLFASYLSLPLDRLRGGATATSNMEIDAGHLRWSCGVCAATLALCVALSLWRFRRRDVQ